MTSYQHNFHHHIFLTPMKGPWKRTSTMFFSFSSDLNDNYTSLWEKIENTRGPCWTGHRSGVCLTCKWVIQATRVNSGLECIFLPKIVYKNTKWGTRKHILGIEAMPIVVIKFDKRWRKGEVTNVISNFLQKIGGWQRLPWFGSNHLYPFYHEFWLPIDPNPSTSNHVFSTLWENLQTTGFPHKNYSEWKSTNMTCLHSSQDPVFCGTSQVCISYNLILWYFKWSNHPRDSF